MSLDETGNFFPPVIAWSNTTTIQFGDTALTGAETLEVLVTTAFVPSVPGSTQLKRPIMSQYYCDLLDCQKLSQTLLLG